MANYPWPATVNFANYFTVKPCLNDEERSQNYQIWREEMVCLLGGQDLLGFVDGQIPQPSPLEKSMEDQRLWRRTDRLVKGWILGSIGHDAVVAVSKSNSCRDVWLELESIFGQTKDDNQNQNNISDSSANGGGGEEKERGGGGILNATVEVVKQPSNNAHQENIGAGLDYNKYLPLCRAITALDSTEVDKILEQDEDASTTIISEIGETALLVAVGVGKKTNDLVRKLLRSMPNEALVIKNSYGNTALHRAAMIGNKEAAVMLVERHPELLYIPNKYNYLPVHEAAKYCHKEVLVYLISVSKKDVENSPFVGHLGASLMLAVIISQFIDVGLYLVKTHPEMATLKNESDTHALQEVARTASVFRSGAKFSWWQNWIYSRIVLTSTEENNMDDIENLSSNDGVNKKSSWFDILYKIPQVKSIEDKKLMHQQAIEVAKSLCRGLESLPSSVASPIYKSAMFLAANNGIDEVVEVITEIFPSAIYHESIVTGGTIFHVAARERFENVFNLLHQMKERKQLFFDVCDSYGNNYMHMCGEQAPPHKLNLVSGAALQMQRELQWFKEMEKFVTPSRRTLRNKAGRTPQMLFTEKHQELKSQGEKWMKDTATSCTIATALIATVVFAAAFTVPGGLNNDNGMPFFYQNAWFVVFAIADSISLFTSTTSLLMFLSILTSRYAEEDFLYVLPQRLCIGLLTLFTSITFMMIAFNTAIYLTLKARSLYFLIVAALACLPVASFVFLQFPLLTAVMYSTYRPGIFGKKTDRTLY